MQVEDQSGGELSKPEPSDKSNAEPEPQPEPTGTVLVKPCAVSANIAQHHCMCSVNCTQGLPAGVQARTFASCLKTSGVSRSAAGATRGLGISCRPTASVTGAPAMGAPVARRPCPSAVSRRSCLR